jgi:hypothetical protein
MSKALAWGLGGTVATFGLNEFNEIVATATGILTLAYIARKHWRLGHDGDNSESQ